MTCMSCGIPDLHDGDGDGIGSCECPRCEDCGAPPLACNCAFDDDITCPCGGDCWDIEPERPIETIDTGGLL